MYVQNLKYNIKGICIFHLTLVGILSILILPVKNREGAAGMGEREYLFSGQNPLSLTKVICWQSQNINFDTFRCSGKVSFSSNFTSLFCVMRYNSCILFLAKVFYTFKIRSLMEKYKSKF